jgi:phenylacetate-CoA ligase
MLATPEILLENAMPCRLGELLPGWLCEVPLYRGRQAHGLADGSPVFPENLALLPFITKADIREKFPHNFLRNGVELEDLLDQELVEVEHTSGTSEERTPLLLGQGWWAEQEIRALRLNPFVADVLDKHPRPRRVTISSPVCSGDICYTGVPLRSERILGDALFVSLSRLPFLWSQSDLARMAQETVQWEPVFLDTDPAYGVVFALFCERQGIRLPSVKFILCSYEFLSVAHRHILERVFGVPVFNLYGSTETGHLLMETEPGLMRASLETAHLELLNPDEHGVGELAVTTLTNEFMPLVRYRIGDLAERRTRPYSTRYIVHGRTRDAFSRPSGRQISIHQVDQCFADLPGFAHYQLCEQPGNRFSLRFVADLNPPSPGSLEELHRRITAVLGEDASVAVAPSEFLMPESSGKFRLCYPL